MMIWSVFNDTATTKIYTYCPLFPYTSLFRSSNTRHSRTCFCLSDGLVRLGHTGSVFLRACRSSRLPHVAGPDHRSLRSVAGTQGARACRTQPTRRKQPHLFDGGVLFSVRPFLPGTGLHHSHYSHDDTGDRKSVV